MSLDPRDPHYALGVKHGRANEEPYPFQDPENLRRYLTGYEVGAAQRRLDGFGTVENIRFIDRKHDLQQPWRITATDLQRWMNQRKP
jgi:hypothetical protein